MHELSNIQGFSVSPEITSGVTYMCFKTLMYPSQNHKIMTTTIIQIQSSIAYIPILTTPIAIDGQADGIIYRNSSTCHSNEHCTHAELH